ncbi:MAG: tripartite tricarboxylate transporter permease [Faecalibacterium sp.]
MDFNLLLSSYAAVWSNPEVILMTFIGALGGVLLGAIPGMTATMGVALLIPFSFGMDLIPSIGLLDGFQFIPTLIGLFAVSEVIAGVERIIRGEEQEQKSKEKITNVLPDLKTIRQIWPNILSGGLIGTFIGAIPGAGGDIAVFVSYGASKSASKHPELYGTGIPNGVAATESANNGCSGGAIIPLLSLGVPGDSVTAILLGAFSINKNAFDVGVCVAFGIIGWLMNKYEFPLSPILLALILGPMCEKNFVRYMNIQRGNFFAITTSPIAMVFAAVAILVIVFSMYNQSKINKKAAATAQEKA